MTVRQTFESAPIPYRLRGEISGSPQAYNLYLRDPPRLYDETLRQPFALWTEPDPTLNGQLVVRAMATLDQVPYPAWGFHQFVFDAATGAFMMAVYDQQWFGFLIFYISVGRDFSLWSNGANSSISRRQPPDYAVTESHSFSSLGGLLVGFVVDQQRGLIVGIPSGANGTITVREFPGGDTVRNIQVCGLPVDIFLEDDSRAYVVDASGILTLVDYVSGDVLGISKIDLDPASGARKFSWDRFYRRVLVLETTPDNADGSATARIWGYYPQPIATNLTPAIPLQSPRKGRTVPVIARVGGNIGEPITGAQVARTYTGPGIIQNARAITDRNGYAHWQMKCTDEGSETINLSTEQ